MGLATLSGARPGEQEARLPPDAQRQPDHQEAAQTGHTDASLEAEGNEAEAWGIDMTKFLVEPVGWVYLVIVLDWYTKKIVGYDISLRCRRQEWEAALDRALQAEFPEGVRGQRLRLVSDNGSQITATGFMKYMARLDIEQVFTSYNNPKGNAETERMIRTIKEEVLWLEEFTSFSEAKEKIGPWIEQDYNELYPHSALGYYSPVEFEARLRYQAEAP